MAMQLRFKSFLYRHRVWSIAGAVVVLAVLFLVRTLSNSNSPSVKVDVPSAAGPPWHQGPRSARFTVIIYADLECPYCQSYTPLLRHWVDMQPDVNLQWRHLPLSIHQPAAGEHARWVECVGTLQGHERFWEAVSWVYEHTRGGGLGLPPGLEYPAQDQAVRSCMDSEQTAAAIKTQAKEAQQMGLEATPSLRLVDHSSERTMTLTGPILGDALLSALDLLSAPDTGMDSPSGLSADVVSDKPR